MTQKEFLDAVELYLSQTGTSASQFGRLVCGDPSLVLELRRGREPRLSLFNRAVEFMRTHPAAEREPSPAGA